MKNNSYLSLSFAVGALFVIATPFIIGKIIIASPSNMAAVQASAAKLSQNTGDVFSVELNMEDQTESLKYPQRFFSGREIKIFKGPAVSVSAKMLKSAGTTDSKREKMAILVSGVSLSLANNSKMKAESGVVNTKLETDVEEGASIVKLPDGTATGKYNLNFSYKSNDISMPIEITGSDVTTKIAALSKATHSYPSGLDISTANLGCQFCYWELSSGVNPSDENYGYVIGGGASDYLVHTTDAWASSTIDNINQIVSPFLSQYAYRGDPYLAFDADNKMSILSLFSDYGSSGGGSEMITGGIYKEKIARQSPLQLSQTVVKSAPPVVPPGTWIVFDYAKLSIDIASTSPYKGNMYVFSNAALAADGIHGGQGQYVIAPNGSIMEKIANYGNAITATVVGPNGEVYGVKPGGYETTDMTAPTEGHYIIRSFNGGDTFSRKLIAPHASDIYCAPRLSIQSSRAAPFYLGPDIAVDKNSGRIYAAWSDPTACIPDQSFEYQRYGFDFNVYASHSDDNGATWSVPVQVDDDLSQGDQSFPSMAVDDNGDVYVAFVDHRNNQDKSQFDIYLSKSTDHGKTFSQNLQVNNVSVPDTYGGVRNIGDYLRMVSIGPQNIYVAYPCASGDPNYSYNDSPGDACVSVISKATWNPPIGRPPLSSDCTYIAPRVVLSSYPAVAVIGNNQAMSVRVYNQNHAGCSPSNFNVTATSPLSWQFTFPTSPVGTGDVTILPGAFGYMDVNFQLPNNILPGTSTLSFEITDKTSSLKTTAGVPVQVIPPVTITSIDPTYGPAGTAVVISGTSFAPYNNQVSMWGTNGWSDPQMLSSSNGKILFTIPSYMNHCDTVCNTIPTPDGYYTINVYANNSSASANFSVGTKPLGPTTAKIIGTSTLTMVYDTAGGENMLESTFDVAVSAGSQDQKVSKSSIFWTYVKTDGGYSMGGAIQYAQPSGTTDDGNGYYVIPANTTAVFNVQTTYNPKIMFAGAYYGVLGQVVIGDWSSPTYLNIPSPNTTNTVVIIGEVSPYINSISSTSTPSNQQVTIDGVRFAASGNTLTLMNRTSGITTQQIVGSTNSGRTIQFTPNVPSGDYYIQVTHPTTGASNRAALNVTDPVVTQSVTPERVTVNSGSTAVMTFGVPANVIKSTLLMYCPSGLKIAYGAQNDICNTTITLSLSPDTSNQMQFGVTNTTSSVLKAVPNFYVYYSSNPNFAVGVSGEITILGSTNSSNLSPSIPAMITYTCPDPSYVLHDSLTSHTCTKNISSSNSYGSNSYNIVTIPATPNYSCPSGYNLNSGSKMCTLAVGSYVRNTANIWDMVMSWFK